MRIQEKIFIIQRIKGQQYYRMNNEYLEIVNKIIKY